MALPRRSRRRPGAARGTAPGSVAEGRCQIVQFVPVYTNFRWVPLKENSYTRPRLAVPGGIGGAASPLSRMEGQRE